MLHAHRAGRPWGWPAWLCPPWPPPPRCWQRCERGEGEARALFHCPVMAEALGSLAGNRSPSTGHLMSHLAWLQPPRSITPSPSQFPPPRSRPAPALPGVRSRCRGDAEGAPLVCFLWRFSVRPFPRIYNCTDWGGGSLTGVISHHASIVGNGNFLDRAIRVCVCGNVKNCV